jgi:hypothetical protein
MTTTICTVCGTAITTQDTSPCDTSDCPIPMPAVVAIEPLTMRGTVTEIEAPKIAASNTAPLNAIAKAHEALIAELAPMQPPRIHVNPHPEEFEDVADYILRVSQMVDRWLLAVGTEVRSNATTHINLDLFKGMMVDAVDGWATSECDTAAAGLRDEYEDNPGPLRLYRSIMGMTR